jgi:NTE family protein
MANRESKKNHKNGNSGDGGKLQTIALVLQGGGALGAYQAGVYQALQEHQMTPTWIVGTSIGAINAALIAGNPPELRLARLREFWDTVSHPDLIDMRQIPDDGRKINTWMATVDAFMRGVTGFFSPRTNSPFALGLPVAPEQASFYDTSDLAATLTRLVDFDYLNANKNLRLTIGATRVTTGELVLFDSSRQRLGVEHIMASGALPPGFPPVRIDGELYWDGGLYSNTPLEIVLEEEPNGSTLCFMVDLWSGVGPEPTTLYQLQTRLKDVTYASRSKQHIDDYLRLHQLRCKVRALYDKLPPELQTAEERQSLADLGCGTTIHIVRLAYAGRDWQMASKDVNFSRGSIEWRWEQGYADTMRAREHEDWLSFKAGKTGLVLHEVGSGADAPLVRPEPEPKRSRRSRVS